MQNVIIRTQYKTNANGGSQILAKGAGKQRTVGYDPSRSSDWNHGNAAGTLALVLGLDWHDSVEHDMSEDGVRHGFKF